MIKIEHLGHEIVENQPFEINRPDGSYRYIFFHFISKVTIVIANQEIEATPGSCILYSPKYPQNFYVMDNRLNHDFVDFTIDDENFFKKIKFPLNTLIHPKSSNSITLCVKEMFKEFKEAEYGYEYLLNAMFTTLLINISRKIHVKSGNSKKLYDEELKLRFEKIRLDMYLKPDKLEVSTLAESLGFSLSHFNYLYKEYFNITPIKDLTNARIHRVNELIKENVSTKIIIKTIGFTSEEYFYRWFKKNNKVTKVEFEKKVNNNQKS